MDGEIGSKKPDNWTSALYRFSQTTTVDGVKQITEPTPFCARRLVWIALLLGGIALVARQIADSVLYYHSRPVTVNLNIKYNKTLKFPAVTICNQNNFRATVASTRGQFDLISDIYVRNSSLEDKTYEDDFYSESVAGSMFALKHDKHDLIHSCKWDNDYNCSADDFITSPTDHGICYSFNSGRDDKPIRYISQTGADSGLKMKLNIEQYEYMQGPNHGAGLKILVHDPSDVPMVKDLGLAVKPGTHTYMDINIIEVHNLPPPHGHCEEKNLTLFSKYAMSTCLLECKTLHITSLCGCIDYYMPWKTSGGPPFCTIRQFLECVKPSLEAFNVADECDCPVPCNMTILNPSITLLANSDFDVEKMLHQNHSELQEKYTYAQEVRQRVDASVSEVDQKMAADLKGTVKDFNEMFDGILASLDSIDEEVKRISDTMDLRTKFHYDTALDSVHYVVRHNFIRGWEIIDERTFPYISGSFFQLRSSILQLFTNIAQKDELTKRVEWQVLFELIQNKLHLCERAKENLTKVYNAYKTGDPLLNFKKTKDGRYDLDFISLELLHGVIEDGGRETYYSDALQAVSAIEDSLKKVDLAMRLPEDGMVLALEAIDEFVDACKTYNLNIFLFKERIVEAPLTEAERRMSEFQLKNKAFKDNARLVLDMTFELCTSINAFLEITWRPILESVDMFVDYVDGKRISKSEMAETFRSRGILMSLLTVEQYFDTLHLRLVDIKDLITKFGQSYLKVYGNMLSEPSTRKFYSRLGEELKELEINGSRRGKMDRYYAHLLGVKRREISRIPTQDLYTLMNADFSMTNWEILENNTKVIINRLLLKSDHDAALGKRVTAFINTVGDIVQSLKDFEGKSQIDHNFYRENFIHLDIFFHELSLEVVDHQIAYDLTNLLSDIGGLIELFLGASILSFFEIFDFIFCTFVCRGKKSKTCCNK